MARRAGAKLGTRIAGLVTRSIVETHRKLTGAKHKLAMAIFHSISDVISDEVHQTMDPVFSALRAGAPDNSLANKALQFMHEETGQLQALAGSNLIAGGILSSVSTIVNNELAPSVYGLVASNPHGLPDSGTIAQMIATGVVDADTGTYSINGNGLSTGWANDLVEAATAYPDVVTALDLVRRGVITEQDFYFMANRAGYNADSAAKILQTINSPLSPADAALAYLRGNLSEADAQSAAAESGVSADTFATMVDNTGEPLGLEQLLQAYRRGFIDEATLTKGILESRVRNEWAPTAIQLAYSPMSTADAVQAVVQNQLDESTAATYAQQNGLAPDQFATLLATAGSPLSRTEMEELYNRGLATEDQVNQALSESRLKPKYNALAFELHTRLLTPALISDTVLYGAMDQPAAVSKVMDLGYSTEDATTLVNSASNAKMFSYRNRVVEDVAQLYEVNALDSTTAAGYITSMGWSDEEAAVILQAAEYNREKRIQSAAITSIRSKYVGHRIIDTQAESALSEIGVPSGEVSYLLNLWTIELDANIQYLTPVYVAKAVTATLMSLADATAYLVARGYSEADATILAQVAG